MGNSGTSIHCKRYEAKKVSQQGELYSFLRRQRKEVDHCFLKCCEGDKLDVSRQKTRIANKQQKVLRL